VARYCCVKSCGCAVKNAGFLSRANAHIAQARG